MACATLSSALAFCARILAPARKIPAFACKSPEAIRPLDLQLVRFAYPSETILMFLCMKYEKVCSAMPNYLKTPALKSIGFGMLNLGMSKPFPPPP